MYEEEEIITEHMNLIKRDTDLIIEEQELIELRDKNMD